MNLHLLWERCHPVHAPLLVTRDLVVVPARAMPGASSATQVFLRAFDPRENPRWELAEANVDRVELVPHLVQGLLVAAVVSRTGAARLLDIDTDGNVLVDRRVPGRWPRTLDALALEYTTLLGFGHDSECVVDALPG